MIVVRSFGSGKIGAKFKTIGGALVLGEEFIWDNIVAARQCMISKCTIPGTDGGRSIAGTCRWILAKELLVGSAFKYSPILKNYTRSDDEWIGIKILRVSGRSDKWCQVGNAKNNARILMCIILFEDICWKSLVVEDVGGDVLVAVAMVGLAAIGAK
jgi:hypothetical protein